MNKEIIDYIANVYTVLCLRNKTIKEKCFEVVYGRHVPWDRSLFIQFCSVLSEATEEDSPILMLSWKDHIDLFLSECKRLSVKREETDISELGEYLARITEQKCPEGDTGTMKIDLYLRTEKNMSRKSWKLMSGQSKETSKEGWEHRGVPIISVVIDSVLLNVIHIRAKKEITEIED